MTNKFKAGTELTVEEYNWLENNVLNTLDPIADYCAYLKDKHGACRNSYFATKDCNSKLNSYNGMHRHHDGERYIAGLSRPDVARANDWKWQLAENLTPCKPAEHVLIHILIAEEGQLGICGAMKLMGECYIEPKLQKILEDRLNASATVFMWNRAVTLKAVDQLETYHKCYMFIATGAGKSTAGVETAKAVNRDFYVLAPTKTIINSWEFHNATNPRFKGAMSYTKFCSMHAVLDLANTLLITDEAHHLLEAGHGKWGEAVQDALAANPDLMLLGLSASKYRAKNRKKADGMMEEVWHRLFDGHVAEGIQDLAEGIEKNIFAPITYICACYDKSALSNMISLSSSWTTTERHTALKGKLDVLRNEANIANLLNTYQSEPMVRDLVFIEHLGEVEVADEETGMLVKVNDYEQAKAAIMAARPYLTDDNFRLVSSRQSDEENKTCFDWFETEAEDARYLISVGMVKEGYHPEIITGGLIFRRISAGTVFEQILGRFAVLVSKVKHNITVFDFVDAVRSARFKFEAGVKGSSRGARPEIVQKLSKLTSCGVQVIDYTEQLNLLEEEFQQETVAPVFSAEELL